MTDKEPEDLYTRIFFFFVHRYPRVCIDRVVGVERSLSINL